MNLSKIVAPAALVVALGATGFTALNMGAASADTTAPLQTRLANTQADLRESNKQVEKLTALVQDQSEQIDKLVTQDRKDQMLRDCSMELGKMIVNGMSVSYGWASPDQGLSEPCSDWLWEDENMEGE